MLFMSNRSPALFGRSPEQGHHFATYVLPGLGALVTLVLSMLLGWQQPEHVLWAVLLCALLFGGVGVAQYWTLKDLLRRDRMELYRIVSAIALSPADQPASGLLHTQDVLAIESVAEEVWVYAYDLAWEEDENSPFTRIVKENLTRGVSYRYLIPDLPEVIERAKQIRARLSLTPRTRGRFEVRSHSRERAVTQFGLSIYNPSWQIEKSSSLRPQSDSVAVYYPHFDEVQESMAATANVFFSVRGKASNRLQEAFAIYWKTASVVK